MDKDKVGAIIVIAAFAALMMLSIFLVYFLGMRLARTPWGNVTTWTQAFRELTRPVGADVALRLPKGRDQVVIARSALPEQRHNRSWYANWVMVADRAHNSHNVQVGLIRRPSANGQLRGYIGIRNGIGVWQYHDFALAEGSHALAIRRLGNRFSFEIDAKPYPPLVALAMKDAYVQVGPQISNRQDTLSGVISQIGFITDGRAIAADLSNPCLYDDHGLHLTRRGNAFVASGTYDATLPAKYDGDCRAFGKAGTIMTR